MDTDDRVDAVLADGAAWHALESSEVVERLATDPDEGLSTTEAERRIEIVGPNQLTVGTQRGPVRRFLAQFNQPLIYILLGATVVTIALGEWVDAAVIFGVVLANSIIGFVQEARAMTALDALARTMTPVARVLRDGDRHALDATDLVPGDVVVLEAGDRVPADVRLVSTNEVQIDESALTGEAVPVSKDTDPVDPDTVVADRTDLAHASTVVTAGRAEGVVVATGDRSEVGRVASLLSAVEQLQTPLTRRIAQFSKVLLVAILVLATFTFLVGLARGFTTVEIFLATVALTVGAIPEGLPATMTIMLAIGVSRMARRRAIIRKLPAVETLGSTTVICSDKTGTLTANEMTVQRLWAGEEHFAVSGVDYGPEGEIFQDAGDGATDAVTEPRGALETCLRTGLLCNDSELVEGDEGWFVEGDPTEGALVVAAHKAGLHHDHEARHRPQLDVIPFSSERQFMATLHAAPDGGHEVLFKGSVEAALDRCDHLIGPDGERLELDPDRVHEAMAAMASDGMRVLAMAWGPAPEDLERLDPDELGDLGLAGLQGMIDPPRDAAIRAVADVKAAGITVSMITGDHPATALAIAEQLGIVDADERAEDRAVTGRQLLSTPAEELPELARHTRVFARVAPEQKLNLVEALQHGGEVVAMTGDGVNDAPALKQADIGIAMGVKGTDAAKDAADMVLTDDDFASIAAAVEEGRSVFDNLTKYIVWTLPTNLGEALVVLTAVVAGTLLPILPAQILWINMMTALLLGLTLVFEPREPDVMTRPPRRPKEPIIGRDVVPRILLVGGCLVGVAFAVFRWELSLGSSEDAARAAAVNAFVATKIAYLFSCRSLDKGVRRIGLFSNPWVWAGAAAMIVAQLGFTYLPFMQEVFSTAATSADSWLRAAGLAMAAGVVMTAEKLVRTARRGDPAPQRG